jgi:hypothetical protein
MNLTNLLNDVKKRHGETITTKDFELLYTEARKYFVEKYGEPERSFLSVVGFGTRTRDELKEMLHQNGIEIQNPEAPNEYGLKQTGFSRISELQQKLKSN